MYECESQTIEVSNRILHATFGNPFDLSCKEAEHALQHV